MTQPVPDTTTPGLSQPGANQAQAPDWFIRYLRVALSDPLFSVPKTFETWMTDRVAVAGLDVPIGQIIGFSGFTVQAAPFIFTAETTTATTYGDLTTVGPSLTGLPNGQYMVLYGSAAHCDTSDGSNSADISIQTNTDAIDDNDATVAQTDVYVSIVRAVTKKLNNGGNNTITAKYRSSSTGTAYFARRWMIAIKFANA